MYLSSGETMIRVDRAQSINRAEKRGLFVLVSTNGFFIPEKGEDLQKTDIVFLSFDREEEVHDNARGKGSDRKAVEAMSVLESQKRKFWTTTVLNKTN